MFFSNRATLESGISCVVARQLFASFCFFVKLAELNSSY